jgi:hypothetical protein
VVVRHGCRSSTSTSKVGDNINRQRRQVATDVATTSEINGRVEPTAMRGTCQATLPQLFSIKRTEAQVV